MAIFNSEAKALQKVKEMILYAGLSIDKKHTKKKFPQISFRPPITRTQIYKDFEKGYRVFLIADGEFDQSLAVSSGEIMDIIRAGGLVFGSSSMGALRAAELYEYGMIGVGEIFNVIQSTENFMDDWLGHLFDPYTHEMTTLPFIEVLFILKPYLDESITKFGVKISDRKSFRFDSLTQKKCYQLISSLKLKQEKAILRSVDSLFSGKRKPQKRIDAELMISQALKRLQFVRQINKRLGGE